MAWVLFTIADDITSAITGNHSNLAVMANTLYFATATHRCDIERAIVQGKPDRCRHSATILTKSREQDKLLVCQRRKGIFHRGFIDSHSGSVSPQTVLNSEHRFILRRFKKHARVSRGN